MSALDARLFHLVNVAWANRLFDAVLPALTDAHRSRWLLWFVVPAAGAWLWRGRARAAKALLGLVLVVGLSDATAYRIVKPLVARPRPDPAVMEVVRRAPVGGVYGFPSNHAANCFAGAAYLGRIYPMASVPLFAAAALVGYSRVYVGAHYPFDVLGGALLGLAIGWLGAAAFKRLEARG